MFCWCFLLLFCCFPIQIWTARSGIFVDNGIDQTVMDTEITDEEKRDLEEKLLDFLGLPGYNKIPSTNADLRKPASMFLMDIYKSLMEEEDGKRKKRETEASLTKDEEDAIEVSDLIMTFESVDGQISGVRHEKGKRLWFNISDTLLTEEIIGAELRIYQDGNFAKKHKHYRDYTVTVFQLTQSDEGENELEYLSSTNTTTTFTGWLQINLTKCVENWAAFPNSNKGLYLSVHPTEKPSHEIKLDNLGLITTNGENPMQPFMVVFLRNENFSAKERQVRDIYPIKRSKKSAALTMSSFINRDPYSGGEKRTCNIHTLYVDFEYLNWSSWIIAPPGVPANYCYGKCDFPLNAHVNATNHAIVQSMMHLLMNHLEYPKPCCTPMKLNPISVLYYSEDNSVALKKYKNMVVKSCGCH